MNSKSNRMVLGLTAVALAVVVVDVLAKGVTAGSCQVQIGGHLPGGCIDEGGGMYCDHNRMDSRLLLYSENNKRNNTWYMQDQIRRRGHPLH